MKCPFCGDDNIRVVDSRSVDDSNAIRRRRQCDNCGRRFTTFEKIETIPIMVVKKDSSREAYDRSKIEAGIFSACHKRPVSRIQIDDLVNSVESEVFNMADKEVSTSLIGEMVMDKLKELDEVAYVRFASVYREFKDVNTFLNELEKIYKRR